MGEDLIAGSMLFMRDIVLVLTLEKIMDKISHPSDKLYPAGKKVREILSREVSMKHLLLIGMVILLPGQVRAATVAAGSLSDATGDNRVGVADIVSLSMTVDSGGFLIVSARFAPGTFASDTYTSISFDTDQNPATGFPGITSGNADAGLIGVDFILQVYGSAYQATSRLLAAPAFTLINFYSVSYLANGYDVQVPLSALGGDNGLLNFKGTVQRHLSANTFTGIGDYISELGQPVGSTSAVPEPGTIALTCAGVAIIGLLNHRKLLTR